MNKNDSSGAGNGKSKQRAARPYRKEKRAAQEADTHRRIVEAALALYASVGPAATTVTEIARQAGVSRMTVYNHFPADGDLFEATFERWFSMNPTPEIDGWRAIDDVDARLGIALAQHYAWYSSVGPTIANLLRDAALVPALDDQLRLRWSPRVEQMIDILSSGRESSATTTRLRAALRVALDFGTWRTLTAAGLTDRDAAEVAAGFVIVTDAG
jgi:AcrR family transcriptional regulator